MMRSRFATVMIQFVPASFVVGAGMELFMLNTVRRRKVLTHELLVLHIIASVLQTTAVLLYYILQGYYHIPGI